MGDPGGLVERLSRRLAERTPRQADVPGYRQAAVLVPLLFKLGEPHLLFTQRTQHVATHKGQVSFPGGVIEPQDADAAAAALRETEEEIGVPARQVRILGRLDDHVTNTSGFVIAPFVSVIPADAPRLTSDLEVARILEVPLAFLLEEANREADEPTSRWRYLWPGAPIWGATARILEEFLSILEHA